MPSDEYFGVLQRETGINVGAELILDMNIYTMYIYTREHCAFGYPNCVRVMMHCVC